MKRPKEHQLETESKNAFRNLVRSNWIVDEKNLDYGVDLEVRIVEGEDYKGRHVGVQLKGTSKSKSDLPIKFRIKTKHLKLYEKHSDPIFLLYFIEPLNTFYGMFTQKYIFECLSKEKPKWRNQKTVTLKLDKKIEKHEDFEDLIEGSNNYLKKHFLSTEIGYRLGTPIYDKINDHVSNELEKGDQEFNSKNYEESKKHYYTALSITKEILGDRNLKALCYSKRAMALGGLNNREMVNENCNKAKELLAGDNKYINEHTWFSIGIAKGMIGEHDDSVEAFNKVIDINPKNQLCWFNLSKAYFNLGKYKLAEEGAKKATKLDSSDAKAWYNLGTVRVKGLRNFEGALKALEKAVKLDPDFAKAWTNLATVKLDLEDFEGAENDLERAIELNPEDKLAKWSLGLTRLNQKEYKSAEEAFSEATKLDIDDTNIWDKSKEAHLWFNLGWIRLNLENYRAAEEAFEKSLEFDDKNSTTWYNLSCTYSLQNKTIEAIEALKRTLKLDDYFCDQIPQDSDLDNVRDENEFQDIVNEYCKKKN